MSETTTPPTAGAAPRGFLGRLDATGVPTLLLRLVVGYVFVTYGMEKVAKPHAFLTALKNYEILPLEPPTILNAVAVTLPWIEVFVGVLLIVGAARRAAATISFGMLCVFTVAVTMLALQYQADHPEIAFTAIEIECGCGTGPINAVRKLVENTGLALASLWLMVSRSHRFSIRSIVGGKG